MSRCDADLLDRITRGDFGIEDAPAWEQPFNPLIDSVDADDWPDIPEADYAYLTGPREKPEPCPWCAGRLVHSTACLELRLSWQVTMPFGKHKGKRLAEVPRDYLEWLARVASVDSDLKTAARRQLKEST